MQRLRCPRLPDHIVEDHPEQHLTAAGLSGLLRQKRSAQDGTLEGGHSVFANEAGFGLEVFAGAVVVANRFVTELVGFSCYPVEVRGDGGG